MAQFVFDPKKPATYEEQLQAYNFAEKAKANQAPTRGVRYTTPTGVSQYDQGYRTRGEAISENLGNISQDVRNQLTKSQGYNQMGGDITQQTLMSMGYQPGTERYKNKASQYTGIPNINELLADTSSDLYQSVGQNKKGFTPSAQKAIDEANRLAQQQAENQKKQADINSLLAQSGKTGYGESEAITPEILTNVGNGQADYLSQVQDLIGNVENLSGLDKANIDFAGLNLQNQLSTASQISSERQNLMLDQIDFMKSKIGPDGLSEAEQQQIAQPYDLAIEANTLQGKMQISKLEYDKNEYEMDMDRNINKMELDLIKQNNMLGAMAKRSGVTYDSGAATNMMYISQQGQQELAYLKAKKSETSAFLGEQIGYIEQQTLLNNNNYKIQANQAIRERYDKLMTDIYNTRLEYSNDSAIRKENESRAISNYISSVSDIMTTAYTQIQDETKKSIDSATWIENHDEAKIFNGENFRINDDGSVTQAWINKQNGQIELTTQELGIEKNQQEQFDIDSMALSVIDGTLSMSKIPASKLSAVNSRVRELRSPIESFDLTSDQEMQAKNLSVEIFGKVRGQSSENLNPIRKLISEGKTINDIKDMLKSTGYSSAFSGAWKGAANQVTFGLSAENKEDIRNEIDRYIQDGDTQGAQMVILDAALTKASTAKREEAIGKVQAIEDLSAVANLIEQYRDAGGSTGIFTGNWNNILKRLGTEKDPALTNIAQQVRIAMINYRKSVSGAAFTESESEEYRDLFPNITDSVDFNLSKVNGLIDTFDRNLNTFYRTSIGSRNFNEIFPNGVNNVLGINNATMGKTTQPLDQQITITKFRTNADIYTGLSQDIISQLDDNQMQQLYDTYIESFLVQAPSMGQQVSIKQNKLTDESGNYLSINENPSGLKYTKRKEDVLLGAGLKKGEDFDLGTEPTDNTGGNYIAFKDIPTAIKAYSEIYKANLGDLSIADALANWVGTSEGKRYANTIITFYKENTGKTLDPNTKVAELSKSELSELLKAQMKKENRKIYNAYYKKFA